MLVINACLNILKYMRNYVSFFYYDFVIRLRFYMYKTFLMPRKIFATLTSSQCKVNGRAETRRLRIFNRSRNQEVKPEAGYFLKLFLEFVQLTVCRT